ncbi:MAG: hypothetical protein R3B40_06175 [Polyangiales bacterium]|nr:hypothetical protein [Myxococcales bacterium]MCB9657517.1 hypothetical protein [Sandaracinaceae bacterium]
MHRDLRIPLHVFLVFVTACGGEPDATAPAAAAGASPAAAPPGAPAAPAVPATSADFDALTGCALLTPAEVGVALDATDVQPEEQHARGHLKGCRYTWRDGDAVVSLELVVERRRDGHPSFDRALATRVEGLPVVGRADTVQTFTAVPGLGQQALYSGNVADLKSLFVRVNPMLQLSLQHARTGADTGDLSAALRTLAQQVMTRL